MYIRVGNLCGIEEDLISDFQNALAENDDLDDKDIKGDKDDEDTKVDKPDEEDNEDNEDNKDNEKDEEENEEDKEKKVNAKNAEIPNYKEVTKKYPDLFKDFPQFRHVFFHEKEYRELFSTVEEAKEAVEQLENFSSLQESLAKGEPEDVISVLESMKELGEDVVSNFSTNFLSSIKKMDQNLYYQVVTPEFVNLTRSIYNAGLRNKNDDLTNSALQIALHLFGDTKVASGEKEVKLPGKEIKKDDRLEQERTAFKNERYSTFYNDIVADSDNKLDAMILDGLDPKNNLSKGMKEVIVEKVRKEISKILSSDKTHIGKMNSLWKKAGVDNFTSSHKPKILSAYLDNAKNLIPKVRSKVRSEILGTRDRNSENNAGSQSRKDRVEPPNNAGGGGRKNNQSSGNGKKIDYSKTSDLDILNDRIVYKN